MAKGSNVVKYFSPYFFVLIEGLPELFVTSLLWQVMEFNRTIIATLNEETKTQHEILTRELFIEMLIRESKLNNSNSFESSDIPSDFITLVTTDFINNIDESNEKAELGISNSSSITNKNKLIWISFGRWFGMKELIKQRDIRRHLKQKWKRLQHALDLQNDANLQVITKMITACITLNLECVVDMDNKTLIHLEFLDNLGAVIKATEAIN
ncbi:9982_t:CDS:2, partial [Funneliformis geosporum]